MKESSALVRRLNKSTRQAIDNRISLNITNLDGDMIQIVGFYDEYLANNHELSTQLGIILFLADREGSLVPINFKSYK